ncbi:hypothetical protein PHLCEN_2v1482 [Hermanssonia centrifuga]|uniref:Uncharacterized protein n=1 Tax=Hermanssonia centrifuga TaxID=98765 RepID=A0A2R6RZW3_9APHY|nr:hypothetical protein PHLCEN_2v1482 [Hermanssonia centrifuga]
MTDDAVSSPEISLAGVSKRLQNVPPISLPSLVNWGTPTSLTVECAAKNCKRTLPNGWGWKMCERCRNTRQAGYDRRRAQQLQLEAEMRLEDAQQMFSANASPAPVATATTPRESVFSVSGLPITHSQTGPSVIHIPATAPAPKKPSRPFIKIPPANPQTTRPATKMKTNNVVSTDKPLAARKSTDAGKMSLFATGWSVDKAIKKLASIPHFNSKGEYIVPQFLPGFSEWRQESNMQPQISGQSLIPPESSPFFQGTHSRPIIPMDCTPTSASIDLPNPRPTLTPPPAPSTSLETPPHPPMTKRLTLRIPSRSKPSSAPPTALQTPSSRNETITRMCTRAGCNTVLPVAHLWVYCDPCLISSVRDSAETTGGESTTGLGHGGIIGMQSSYPAQLMRTSEPSFPAVLKGIQSVDQASSSSLSRVESAPHGTLSPGTPGIFALPTPPPSSRRSSPVMDDMTSSPTLVPASSSALSPSVQDVRKEHRKTYDPWDSDLSELTPLEDSSSESEDETPRYREYCRARGGKERKWLKRDDEDEAMRDSDDEGHRVCTIRNCRVIIPPEGLYRWKMCERCRKHTRRMARKRKYGTAGSSDDDDYDRQLLRISYKKLKLTFKGVPVASVEPSRKETDMNINVNLPLPKVLPVLIAEPGERFPLYQTFDYLIEGFRSRLAGFLAAQQHYLMFKLAHACNANETKSNITDGVTGRDNVEDTTDVDANQLVAFAFDGEFSIVADPVGGQVGSRIQTVQMKLGTSLGIAFESAGFQVEPSSKIIGLYCCIHDVVVPLPHSLTANPTTSPAQTLIVPPTSESSGSSTVDEKPQPETPTMSSLDGQNIVSPSGREITTARSEGKSPALLPELAVKRMLGELEVSVLWDRSHRLFPGLRTIVRFRLVG